MNIYEISFQIGISTARISRYSITTTIFVTLECKNSQNTMQVSGYPRTPHPRATKYRFRYKSDPTVPDNRTRRCRWCLKWRPRNTGSILWPHLRQWLRPVSGRSSGRSRLISAAASAWTPEDRLFPRSNSIDLEVMLTVFKLFPVKTCAIKSPDV